MKIDKFLKIWNYIWGFIGGLAVVVGITAGLMNIYEKTHKEPKQYIPSPVKEYIFGNKFYYLQVLTDSSNKVIAYGITTREKDFNPQIRILESLYYVDQTDSEIIRSGSKNIILGKTKFSELGKADNIFVNVGAHDFYYHEEYYFGNPGNYQTYFFSANESGYLEVGNLPSSFFDNKVDQDNPEVNKFREDTPFNTLYVTAPMEGDNIMLRKYLVGPDRYQVRVIPDRSLPTASSSEQEIIKISKLSTNVDIENIIQIFGRPLIVNDTPTFEIRDDKSSLQKLIEDQNLDIKSFQ